MESAMDEASSCLIPLLPVSRGDGRRRRLIRLDQRRSALVRASAWTTMR